MGRKKRLVAAVAVALGSGLGIFSQAAPAFADSYSASAAAQFVADINALRASHGLGALAVNSSLVSMADNWSVHLAGVGSLSHNPGLASEAPAGWRLLGENVGVGPSVSALQAAFTASPEHYANMVDPAFSEIGVAVYTTSQGYMWVTEDYMEPPAGAPIPSTPLPPPTPSQGTAPSGTASTGTSSTGSGAPAPTPSVPLVRLAGADRVQTSVAGSRAAFPNGGSAHVVVLAGDANYPDALVGGPLAAKLGGPLLLTGPDALDPAVQAEMARVLPAGGTVYLLGGDDALSADVESAVASLGYGTDRLAGADRYATATAVADALGDPSTVLEASGQGFADALSAGPVAVAKNAAILLTDGSSQAPETASYLAEHPAATRIAVGGPAAQADPGVSRALVGGDRYATAAMAAFAYFPAPKVIGLATGLDFPDGLVAGPYTASHGGPLLLVPGSGAVPTSTAGYLHSLSAPVQSVVAYGGNAAVGSGIASAVQADVAHR